MIGTGLTFAGGLGGLAGAAALLGWAVGELTVFEIGQVTVRVSVVSFILGVAFSGALALVARRQSFASLSVPLVASMGGVAGLLYYLFCLVMAGYRAWDVSAAIGNFVLLVTLGACAAVATLLVARQARASADEDTMPDLHSATSAALPDGQPMPFSYGHAPVSSAVSSSVSSHGHTPEPRYTH
ncbi:MAG TPA: hypothetical protein DGD08_18520 [Gemmatimonas aurantiaca]|uniref:Uncharacterized protein n=2 Tax=Gemmatimonas aurantiaca TaxID=173480 RepID=A0A3D4VDI9_9BACT|nr:hypothetical protein [Gemmatimonas aurantiaca]